MCDSQTPYDKILRLAEAFLAERFPAHADKIKAGDCYGIVSPFVMDLLSHHKIPSLLHRMDEERQEQLIGGVEELLFEDVPDTLVAFYATKFGAPPPRDILEICEEIERKQ